jgi:hypothetical protein
LAALLAAAGIIWNPETGIVTVLTLVAYMVYSAWSQHRLSELEFWKKSAFSLAVPALCLGGCFLWLQLVTVSRSGSWYPVSSLFWSITFMSGEGYFMLPLPEENLYIYVLGVYSAAVILSLYSLFINKARPNEEARRNALGFATAVMGFGLFMYFLGRSSPPNFVAAVWPAFIALAFMARKLLAYSRHKLAEGKGNARWSGLISGGIAGVLGLAFIFFIFVTALALLLGLSTNETKNYNHLRTTVVAVPPDYSIEVVDKYRTDKLFMVNEYSMFYLSELNLKNDYRGQAVNDYFFKQDYLDIVSQLAEYDGRVFISDNIFNQYVVFADGEAFSEKLQNTLAERYVLIAEEGGWQVYDANTPPLD